MGQKVDEWLATDLVNVVVVAVAVVVTVVVTEWREKKVTKRVLESVPKMEVGVAGEFEATGNCPSLRRQRKMRLELKQTWVRVKGQQEETAGMRDVVIAIADFVAVGTVVVDIEVDEIEHILLQHSRLQPNQKQRS